MTYRQIRAFNQKKAGTRPHWCLQNVRMGFGIGPRYTTAWEAWKKTQQHKGTPPKDLDVPLYFSYTATIGGVRKNWGHIGVRLKNGKFWTDGKTYSSYTYYANKYAPKYVGWGESINGVKVLEKDVYKGRTAKEWWSLAKSRGTEINKLKSDLEKALDKPPKEIVKEVEKIVEKTIEVEPSWFKKIPQLIKELLKALWGGKDKDEVVEKTSK